MSSSLIRKYMNLVEAKLDEISPHNYDSDWDYQDAMAAPDKRLSRGGRDEPDDQGPIDDPVGNGVKHFKIAYATEVSHSEEDGVAPNGRRYNRVEVYQCQNEHALKNTVHKFKDLHHGAKYIVDIVKNEAAEDGSFTATMYYIDYHGKGHFKPFADTGKLDAPLYPDDITL